MIGIFHFITYFFRCCLMLEKGDVRKLLANSAILDACKTLIVTQTSYELQSKAEILDELVKDGILSKSSDNKYSFCCPLMADVFMNVYVGPMQTRSNSIMNPSSPKVLVDSLVVRIDWENLQNNRGIDNNDVLYEHGKII